MIITSPVMLAKFIGWVIYGSLEEILIFCQNFMNKIRATRRKHIHFWGFFLRVLFLQLTVVGSWRFSNPSTIGGSFLLGKMRAKFLRPAIILGPEETRLSQFFSVNMAMNKWISWTSRYFPIEPWSFLFHCHLSYTTVASCPKIYPQFWMFKISLLKKGSLWMWIPT